MNDSVLIETLWNVKDKTTLDFGATVSVLIETLWNVKSLNGKNQMYLQRVLIETLWNVKMTVSSLQDPTIGINRNIVECKGSISYLI